MKVLAVDTSSSVASVAVVDGGRVLGEYGISQKMSHSQKLVPMIRELLSNLELKAADMDLFAASTGPGSFTGLRIGVTTVKALAYAVQKPVVGVPTLDALAFNVPAYDGLVCPIMDARNRQVYTAVYRREEGRLAKVTDYMALDLDELIELLVAKGERVVFNGDAVELHRAYLEEKLKSCRFAPDNLLLQRASSVAMVGLDMANRGLIENCFDLVPFYLRKSQAERVREMEGKNRVYEKYDN